MHRSTDYPTPTRDRRNSSPSSRSSSGFSTPSTTDSSGPTASSSSDTSPPSSSGTPPDAQSKQASTVELVASSSRSANSRGDNNNNKNNGTNHYQSSSSFTLPRSPPDGDQSHRGPPPTPLYVDVKARSVGDIGGIQNQVEAALYAHSSEQRQWEKTMNYCHEATLRSRLEATSSSQQQRGELVSGDDASISPTLPPGPLEKDLLLSSSSSSSFSPANTSSSRSQIGKGQTQPDLHWVNDVIGNGNGRSESGENLIDAVIAHNAAYRLANSAPNGSSSSNPPRTNARGQPARPPMPIATKQLPYVPSTAYGRTSVESTPRASPIAIPSSRGDGSPISSTRPR